MKNQTLYLSMLLFFSTTLNAKTIKVPEDQPKIQMAINEALNGDTVLVSPGIYYENVNFNDKNLVLTSHYLFNNDTSFIRRTIIDGSKPANPDTASCILILKGQNSTTVVQGFTITGGKGTSWKDEHSSGTYREGGGIIIALSSPTIQYNLIIDNEAINKIGLAGTGGGGIRCGDGRPKIFNNVIVSNRGRYGAGIVLNWCGAVIRNNIIAGNIGGEDYAGGGIWINSTNGFNNLIENNTIVNNHSFSSGGGILMYSGNAKATLRNNIIYGNTAPYSPQITMGSNVEVSYCNIDGNWAGTGNLGIFPEFTDKVFYLISSSHVLDAGDPNLDYNDKYDELNPNEALFPSLGLLRNDMGAYGGPGACILPYFQFSRIASMVKSVSFGNSNIIGQLVSQKIVIVNQSTDTRKIDSVIVQSNKNQLTFSYKTTGNLKPSQSDSIIIDWIPVNDQQLNDTILIYHNASNSANPLKIPVTGKIKKTNEVIDLKSKYSITNYPNPCSNVTLIKYTLNEGGPAAIIEVFDMEGKVVKSYPGLKISGVLTFDGSILPEGIYICKLSSPDNLKIENKMLIQH